MRFTLQTSRGQRSSGFTLIEVLIIAPIVVLVIGGFVALMMAMVGDVLLTRDQNVMAYETQDALDRIEQDTRIGTQFLNTSRTLAAPQGSNDGTAAFTSSNALIMGSLATDKNPARPDRQLIYYADQPAACGSSTQSQNRVFINKIIYYMKNGSLWRRVIVPPYNTLNPSNALTICADPWQQNSCSPGYTLIPPCQANDSEVMKNIQAFDVTYYDTPSGDNELTGTDILNATTIDVTITGAKTTSGKAATSSGTVRASKLNSIEADIPPPTSPSVSQSVIVSPNLTANFTWPSVTNATSYNLAYKVNSGGWSSDISVSSATTSYPVTRNRGDIVSFRISSVNASGESPDALAEVTLPKWIDLDLENDWVDYANGYNTAQFTKSSEGRVFLKGLIRLGTTAVGTIMATLPPGYRPSATLINTVETNPNSAGRVDVRADGSVVFETGDDGWVSLDGISFLPSTAPYTWNTMTFQNSWSNFGGVYETVHITKDNIGRVHLQGLAKPGTTTINTQMMQTDSVNTSYRPTNAHVFTAGSNPFGVAWVWPTTGQIAKRGTMTPGWLGLQTMYYPGSLGTWTPLTKLNGWVDYAAGYPTLQVTKAADNVVTIRGQIKNGSTTASNPIANLPAAFRPSKQYLFIVSSNELNGRVDINSAGDIIPQMVTNTNLSLNLSYIVD